MLHSALGSAPLVAPVCLPVRIVRVIVLATLVGAAACHADPVEPDPLASTAGELDAAAASTNQLDVSCAPAALRVPRGSTSTVSCDVVMPARTAGSVSFESVRLPAGIRLHLIGADETQTLAAGTSTTVFLAADVDSTVAPGEYAGTLVARTRRASQRVPITLEVTTSATRVRMIYLIPSDRSYDPEVAWGMERAARHLQIYFQHQLGAGGTFTLHWPAVEVVHSTRPSSYFAADAFGGVGREVWASLGGRFFDPANIWAVYFDVQPTSTTGGAASLATLPANDVRGIVGDDPSEPVRRWVGGLGHEIGHAMGLPHPPGCDDGIWTDDCSSLMYLGYLDYPGTFIAELQKSALAAGPYVHTAVTTTPVLFDVDVWEPTLWPVDVVTSTVAARAAVTADRSGAAIPDRLRHRWRP